MTMEVKDGVGVVRLSQADSKVLDMHLGYLCICSRKMSTATYINSLMGGAISYFTQVNTLTKELSGELVQVS